MAGHDYSHQGKFANALDRSQEALTAEIICENYLLSISLEDQEKVRELILGTEQSRVITNHMAFLAKPNEASLRLQVLINEADISASLLPELSEMLTHNLLLERGEQHPSQAMIRETFSLFANAAQLSSPSALKLISPHLKAKNV
jgi:hypothetical protein